ncbi:NUDIX domain-containing protein [Catenulispora pinisilvae]|uniref:NUDIX domain-containing protein n=1 Tax=Catenulispora pinisilvae TaxID=2705253 RepID=UPI00226566AD|nr:NUDIX domain-containing protein [Catenulispora pinisilvae]
MWQVIGQQKHWLDSHPDADPALAVPLRVLKVAEEAGEAAAALIGVTGQNPRKGRSHTEDDLAAELCDVITAAAVALATVVPDPDRVLGEHIGRVYMRSIDAGAPRLAELGTGLDRAAWAASLPKVIVGASMLFFDETGKVLLVRQSYKQDKNWSFPGGGVEEGEFPAAGARREALEEVGLDVDPGTLLMVDWRPRDKERPPLIHYLYDGGTLNAEQIARIRLQEGEISDYGFFDLDGARDRLPVHAYGRLSHALEVRAGRLPVQDLEEGRRRV